jgi:hypothetical protein
MHVGLGDVPAPPDTIAFMRRREKAEGRSGQAMVEYLIVAVMLIAALSILAVLLYTFKEHETRVLDLVASEFP